MLFSQSEDVPASPGLLARIGRRLYQVACGLHGHDVLLHYGRHRVALQCVSCGYETPGWDVRATPPRTTQPVDRSRRVIQMPLAGQRRVA